MNREEGDGGNNQYALYWVQVCEEFMHRLRAYALRLVNGRTYDADDLVQETLYRVLLYPTNPDKVRNPLAYLRSIMRRRWITKWSQENSANMDSLETLQNTKGWKNHPTVEPDALRILENEDLLKALRVLLRHLNARERRLLILYLRGYKCDEMSQILKEDVRVTRSDLYAVKSKVYQRIRRGIS